MLAEAEIGHRIDKTAFAKVAPSCREALIEAQYELSQSRRFATIVLLTGVSGAGKSETVNRLLTWMDPRYIETLAIGRDETEDQGSRPYMWRFWQVLPPKGRLTILFEHLRADRGGALARVPGLIAERRLFRRLRGSLTMVAARRPLPRVARHRISNEPLTRRRSSPHERNSC